MAFGLGDNQKVLLGIVGIDEANNNAVPPDGTYSWTVSDPAIINIDNVSEDTLRCVVSAVGPLGNANVVAANGSFSAVGELTVVATEARSIALIIGTPAHK